MKNSQSYTHTPTHHTHKNPALIWQVLPSSVKRVLCTKKPVSLYHTKMELDTPALVVGKLLVQSYQPEWLSWNYLHEIQEYKINLLEICELTKETDEFGLLYGDYTLSYVQDMMGKSYKIDEETIISFRTHEGMLIIAFEDVRRCLEWRTGDIYSALEKLMDELTSDNSYKTESFYKNPRNLNSSLISTQGQINLGSIFDISSVEESNPCNIHSAISKTVKVTFVSENGVPSELFIYFDKLRNDMHESVQMAYEAFGSRITEINGRILMEYLLDCYILEWYLRFQEFHLLGSFSEEVGRFEKLPKFGENELSLYKILNPDSLLKNMQETLDTISTDEDFIQSSKSIMLQKAALTLQLHSLASNIEELNSNYQHLEISYQKRRRNSNPHQRRECCLDDLCVCTIM